jgi:hypothetical protein
MFAGNPRRYALAASLSQIRPPVLILRGAWRFLRLPRIGLRTIRVATSSRSAQFASRTPLREIPLRSRQAFRLSIAPRTNSRRICTYKIANVTPLESALMKKEPGARAKSTNLRLSTTNHRLAASPLEYALTQKGGGGGVTPRLLRQSGWRPCDYKKGWHAYYKSRSLARLC